MSDPVVAFALGAIVGILVTLAMCLVMIRRELRRPWWRS